MNRRALALVAVFCFAAAVSSAEEAGGSRLSSREGQLKIAEKKQTQKAEAVKSEAATARKAVPAPQKKIEKKASGPYAEASQADLEMKGEEKELKGKVGGAGVSGIAVEQSSLSEIWFPFTNVVKFKGYKSHTEIGLQDMVEVKYMEAKDGSRRLLKEVRLVSRAPKEEPVVEAPQPDEQIEPESEEQDQTETQDDEAA